jgi:hypothetical protein
MLKLISSEKWSGGLNLLRPDFNYGLSMRGPAVQQQRQIGLSGLKRNIKASLLRSIPDPVITSTIATSNF